MKNLVKALQISDTWTLLNIFCIHEYMHIQLSPFPVEWLILCENDFNEILSSNL